MFPIYRYTVAFKMAYYSQCSLSRHNPPERYPHKEGDKHSSAKYCLPKSEKDVKI